MKHLFRDRRGAAMLPAAFLILILLLFSLTLYNVFSVSARIQSVQSQLERAASIVIDTTCVNSRLRDLQLNLRESEVRSQVIQSLTDTGWNPSGERLVSADGVCALSGLEIRIGPDLRTLILRADLTVPLLSRLQDISRCTFSVTVQSRILYIY